MPECDNSLRPEDMMDQVTIDRFAMFTQAFKLHESSVALYDRANQLQGDLKTELTAVDIAVAKVGFIGPRMLAGAYPFVLRRIADRKRDKSSRILQQLNDQELIDF